MNREADKERLLQDVLVESAPSDFRGVMLGETLRLARGRRRSRQLRRICGGLLLLAMIAGLFLRHSSKPPQVARQPLLPPAAQSFTLIATMPLPPAAIVLTKPLTTPREWATLENVRMVETTGGNFRFISDDQLMAMLGPAPVVLIRTGPHSQELVFANAPREKN